MRCFLSGCCLALSLVLPGTARTTEVAPDFAQLAAGIQGFKEATGLPSGTAIAVVKDGRIVYEGYFGDADIAMATPVSADTVFYIASATKPLFALNALLAEDAGELDTRTTLAQMFPGTPFTGIDAGAVTLRELLVHTSGIDNPGLGWASAFSGLHDTASLRRLVAASGPDPSAGHGIFRYSNVGYNIASVWMDAALAMPWQEQLEMRVFRPLGMRHSSARISDAQAAGWTLARPYSFISPDPRQPLYLAKSDETMHAAGGVVSTVPDLARLLMAELSSDGRAPLPADVLSRSQRSQASVSSKYLDFARDGYAWGWYTGDYKGRRMLHHFGGFAGFHAHLSFIPEAGVGLVVLNNEDMLGAQLTAVIADHVYGTLLGESGATQRLQQRLEVLQAKAKDMAAAAIGQRQRIAARSWRLSLPRERYAGVYSHPLLGSLIVGMDARQAMTVRWGRLASAMAAGTGPDQARVEFVPNEGQILSFETANGRAKAVVFDGLVFARQE